MKDRQRSGNLPYVSIVVPIRNEESFITRCLDSILANDYPDDKFEVVVVDGMSNDESRTIVQQYCSQYENIRLLDNPKKIRVAANNIGIRAAKGEIIISMDAHVVYSSDYIRRCVELLQTTGAANVGGVQKAVGYDYITKVIAMVTTTPFGIGDAEFRYSKKEKCVDTVYLGAWYKQTLEKVGLFNEDWHRNGDYELNYRIRKAGGKILLSPKIKCQYFVRGSLLKLAKQYFLYGIWRVKTIVTHPDSIRWRHLLPPTLILLLLLPLIFIIFGVKFWWIPLAIYLLYTTITSVGLSLLNGIVYLPLLIPTLWILHLSWGLGFYFGIFRFGIPKIRLKTILKDILGKSDI
jgi:glycosyltransferase involved in cell wall biosynthesis